MRTWARWTARAALFTASFAAAGMTTVGIASAGTHTTSGNNSILGGNQVSAPVSIPVNACGNALALLGDAFGGCAGGASVSGDEGSTWTTSGNNSIGGGNQVSAPVSIPVNVCGNAAAVLGDAFAGCAGGASVSGGAGGSTWTTSGNNSIGGGNQVDTPVRVPVNICGNAFGDNAYASCRGGAFVYTSGDGSTWTTSGDNSIGGGNQTSTPVSAPLDICGNAAAVLGSAFAGCAGGAWTSTADAPSSGAASYGIQHYSAGQAVRQSAPASALSGLSSLPVLSGLPLSATSLTGGGSPASGLPVQTSLLSYSSTTRAPGMGSGSLFAIAAAAVLAGVATLIAAGRRLSIRKAGR